MSDDELARQVEEAEKALADAEDKYGHDHLIVAERLEYFVSLLKENKIRLLDAANMEAKAKVIRARELKKPEAKMDSNVSDERCSQGVGFSSRVASESIQQSSNAHQARESDQIEKHSEFEYKQCPFCAETIKAAAVVCRYCHKTLRDNGSGIVQNSSGQIKDFLRAQCTSQRVFLGSVLIVLVIVFIVINYGLEDYVRTTEKFNDRLARLSERIRKNNDPFLNRSFESILGGKLSFNSDSTVEITPDYSRYDGEKLGNLVGHYHKTGPNKVRIEVLFNGANRVIDYELRSNFLSVDGNLNDAAPFPALLKP